MNSVSGNFTFENCFFAPRQLDIRQIDKTQHRTIIFCSCARHALTNALYTRHKPGLCCLVFIYLYKD